MRQASSSIPAFVILVPLEIVAGFWAFCARPALASCAGSGADWDLVATGTVEDIEASRESSRIEVLVDRVSGGDKSKSGQILYIRSDSGIGEASSVDVGFREGAYYKLYLQRERDEWTTNACMGTTEIAAEGTPEASPTLPGTGGPFVPLLAAVSGICLLGAIVVVRQWAR